MTFFLLYVDENSTIGRTAGEGKLFEANQYLNKTQHRYNDGSAKRQTTGHSHIKILKRNSNTDSNEAKKRDENVPQKTAGLLRIPGIHALVNEDINRRKEFNASKEIWPSIDAKEDGNGAIPRGVKSYSSILRATPQLNIPSVSVDSKVSYQQFEAKNLFHTSTSMLCKET